MGKNRRQSNFAQWSRDAQVELDEEADELERQRLWYEGLDDEDIVEPESSTDEGSCYEPGEEYSGAHHDDSFADMAREPFTEDEIVQIDQKLEDHIAVNRECNSKS